MDRPLAAINPMTDADDGCSTWARERKRAYLQLVYSLTKGGSMSIKLLGDVSRIQKGVERIETLYPYVMDRIREPVIAIQSHEENVPSLEVMHTNGAWEIRFQRKCDFFRALGDVLAGEVGAELLRENAIYKKCGAMVDVSRDAAYTPAQLKEFLVWLSLCGLNTCYIYMEDMYRLEHYPYFGYLRGAYTQQELRELDDVADDLGIELVPCIQTLSHLRTTLKWDYALEMRDTADTLFVGSDEAYAFIREMLETVKQTFRTRRVHIGMDEAMDLGTGMRLRACGYVPQFDLMIQHLNRVTNMAQEMGLTPIIWDDMFYRSKNRELDYYDLSVELNEDDISRVPEYVQLTYWDYYHNTQEEYERLLFKRRNFKQYMIFAGGIWKWNGWVPNYSKTFTDTHAALCACRKFHIDEILATMWGDNGGEAPLQTVWPGLVLFGQYVYEASVKDDAISRRCEAFTGMSLAEYRAIEMLDILPGSELPNIKAMNPSKYLLYQDLMLGAFDSYVDDRTRAHYEACALALDQLLQKQRPPVLCEMLKMYECLAKVLARKSTWGVRARAAYRCNDHEQLKHLCAELDILMQEVSALHQSFVQMWCHGTKGTGLEVHDIRLGGLSGRIQTVRTRILMYLDGTLANLDEFEQDILPFCLQCGEGKYPIHNKYQSIATQNAL